MTCWQGIHFQQLHDLLVWWGSWSIQNDQLNRVSLMNMNVLTSCVTCDPLHIWVVVRGQSCLDTPRLKGGERHNVHRPQLRVCLPYMPYGRIRWISVCHLLVLSPSATWQLQMQRPCRWPLSMCECTAGLWSLFLFLETWRRNSTYLLVPTWKHLFFTH